MFENVDLYFGDSIIDVLMCQVVYTSVTTVSFGKAFCYVLLHFQPWSPNIIVWSLYVQENIAGLHLDLVWKGVNTLALALLKSFSASIQKSN